mmetsp:Transcript_37231/g.87008  ORF Transcript_37231/g.87008 Transcript_37231/m.87008 type:complete len:606 (-) Transcript_37231:376-2193(-)
MAHEEDEEHAREFSRKEYAAQQVFDDETGNATGAEQPDGERADSEQPGGEADGASMPSATGAEQGQYVPMAEAPAEPSGRAKQQHRPRPQPNPYNALGDALRYFEEQLDLVERDASALGAEEEAEGAQDDTPAAPAVAGGRHELVQRGEAADTQVLADATDEQRDDERAAADARERDGEEADMAPPPDEAEDVAAPAPDAASSDASAVPEERRGAMEERRRARQRLGRKESAEMQLEPSDADGRDDADADAAFEVGTAERAAAADAGGTFAVTTEPKWVEAAEEAAEEAAKEAAEEARLDEMQESLEAKLAEWRLEGASSSSAEAVWRRFEEQTSALSQELCEQLRLILEATVASKLQGDYRTGKRISMRKVIPYIASGYRKDKIWLRRTKPSKRQYQVMVCVDDSESMRVTGAGGLACEALALLCGALTRLEVGQLAVVSFAEAVQLLHPFERPFSPEAGAHMLSRFTFAQRHTNMVALLEAVVCTLQLAREQQSGAAADQMQLVIIVSDGRRSPSWGQPAQWVQRAADAHVLLCFIIIDSASAKDSILELQSVSYPNGKLTICKYMDSFPFPYYVVLRDLQALPQVLSDALRQWFELSSSRAS